MYKYRPEGSQFRDGTRVLIPYADEFFMAVDHAVPNVADLALSVTRWHGT